MQVNINIRVIFILNKILMPSHWAVFSSGPGLQFFSTTKLCKLSKTENRRANQSRHWQGGVIILLRAIWTFSTPSPLSECSIHVSQTYVSFLSLPIQSAGFDQYRVLFDSGLSYLSDHLSAGLTLIIGGPSVGASSKRSKEGW